MMTDHIFSKGWVFLCLAACLVASQASTQGAVRANYGGRAVVLEFTNEDETSGFEPVVMGNTGELPSNGGSRLRVLRATNLATVIRFSGARASVRGVQNQTVSQVIITNFILVVTPPGQASHTLAFDRMTVTATATCGKSNVVRRSQVRFQGLTLDGNAVVVTGATNQALGFPGGQILLNAQVTDAEQSNGISVAGVFVNLDDDVTGPVGLAEAAIECIRVPDPICERVSGAGLILDSGRSRLGQISFSATTQGNRRQGFLNFFDFRTRQRVRSTQLVNYQILADRTRRLTYSVNLNDGTTTTVTVLASNLRQRGIGQDRIGIASGQGGLEASGAFVNGTVQVQRVACR